MTSVCSVCGVEKEQGAFPKNGRHKDGTVRYRTDCKECYNITRKLTKRKSVTKFIAHTKHRTGEEGTYGLDDWRAAMLHFRGSCAYCGRRQERGVKMTRDHVVPVSQGGLTTKENIVPACARCNSSKGDKPVVDWFRKQDFFSMHRLTTLVGWCGHESRSK